MFIMDELEENANFTLSPNIIGPAMAIALGLETIISFSTNLFVLLFTLCHYKILKESSNILLTNYVVNNLLVAIINMPSIVITAVAGEWIFGSTLEQQLATCRFVGCAYLCSIYVMVFTLTAISVNRFLFIVKPSMHKCFSKPLVTFLMTIVIWLLSCGMSLPYLFRFGEYVFNKYTGTCSLRSGTLSWFVTVSYMLVIVCIGIIIVTTLWSFCYTRKVIKPHQRSRNEAQDHVYNTRLKKIIGLFTALLISTAITFAPAFLLLFFELILRMKAPGGTAIIPSQFYFFNTIMNPVIQSFFRRELHDFVVVWMRKLSYHICEVQLN